MHKWNEVVAKYKVQWLINNKDRDIWKSLNKSHDDVNDVDVAGKFSRVLLCQHEHTEKYHALKIMALEDVIRSK